MRATKERVFDALFGLALWLGADAEASASSKMRICDGLPRLVECRGYAPIHFDPEDQVTYGAPDIAGLHKGVLHIFIRNCHMTCQPR